MVQAFLAGLAALGTVGLSVAALAANDSQNETAERAKEWRVRVAALVAGAADPTTDNLLEATQLIEAAVRPRPGPPGGTPHATTWPGDWGTRK